MEFFDFMKEKERKKFNDDIIDSNYKEILYEAYFSDQNLDDMYNWAQILQRTSQETMIIQSNENIERMKLFLEQYIQVSKNLQETLNNDGIYDLRAEHIGTAFYLVNLAKITFKDVSLFSKTEIKNTLITYLITLGYEGVNHNEIPNITIVKIQDMIEYILSHFKR